MIPARKGSSVVQEANDMLQSLTLHYRGMISENLRSKLSASDLIQETLIIIHKHHESLELMSVEMREAWIYKTLRRELISFVRKYRTSKRSTQLEVLTELSNVSDKSLSDGWNFLMECECQERLDRAYNQLSESEKNILALHLQQELSYKQISDRTGTSEEAVRQAFSRARAAWKALYESTQE
ncbi:sigma-70 family RNA polymerase sigma factor [Telmatocola sphagniphila]|uniref:Sigma-70 family RNA polymerase sigma factor n=1 Tax=Telmatocola sphagniphila TaxID=1123043 RepID=A0A8E6B3B0_9BACT|nr:sigma-70 family RNA polymerase sigma factor [Telmatocola sphagniphila]QVL31395.1 sigma-70 family RNA polymerase sigma factor [Telmatocola sphagniphila]